jgi:hypothetical protein
LILNSSETELSRDTRFINSIWDCFECFSEYGNLDLVDGGLECVALGSSLIVDAQQSVFLIGTESVMCSRPEKSHTSIEQKLS